MILKGKRKNPGFHQKYLEKYKNYFSRITKRMKRCSFHLRLKNEEFWCAGLFLNSC